MAMFRPAWSVLVGSLLVLVSVRAIPAVRPRLGSYVLPCQGVTLTASYLAEAGPGQGPGFLFRIENHTSHAIRLAQPVPSSAHW
jgi:hypothetical protein